jgi:hypothetical protein
MIYGLALLSGLLSLVVLIPAIRQMQRMREINRNCALAIGVVISSASAVSRLWWTASLGNQDRPLIRYQLPKGTELNLDVVTSSIFPVPRYEPGRSLTVVYDRDRPGRAYAQPEWGAVKRDILFGLGALILSIGLWVIGRVFNLPF